MTLTVYKDNNLITASYNLTLSEQRLILSCIGQIKSSDIMYPAIDMGGIIPAYSIYEKGYYAVSAKDYANRFGITERRAHRELIDIAESLLDKKLILSTENFSDLDKSRFKLGKNAIIKAHWVSCIVFNPESKSLIIGFPTILFPYLSQLSREFTKYKLEHVAKMSSAYAIRLYELLIKNQFTRKKEAQHSINELRMYLQLEDKYPLFANFNARILKPAMDQINTHSNINAHYELLKAKGERRKVSDVKFKFEFKKDN